MSAENDSNQWYSNKELFEQLNNMQNDFRDMRSEMKETREIIKKYNGLREEIGSTKQELKSEISILKDAALVNKSETVGRTSVGDGIREWGGWIIALVILIEKFVM